MTYTAEIVDQQLVIRVDISPSVIELAPKTKKGRSKMLVQTDHMRWPTCGPFKFSLMVTAPLTQEEPEPVDSVQVPTGWEKQK